MTERVKRRKRFRIPLPLVVRIRHLLEGKTCAEETVVDEETITDNISTTGCYFLLSEESPVGSIVEMEITVPNCYVGVQQGTLHCRGKVVRVEDRSAIGKVGVACTIESYSFSTPEAWFSSTRVD